MTISTKRDKVTKAAKAAKATKPAAAKKPAAAPKPAAEKKPPVRRSRKADSYLFVLSAASEERLQAYAAKVAAWLEKSPADLDLGDAIYTWQAARTAMKRRLAIKIQDRAELQRKLQQWIAEPGTVADAWTGEVNARDADSSRPWHGESGQRLLDEIIAGKDWERIGSLWTAGADIDWEKLHAASARKPRRISVPTYPFAKERHWIEGAADAPQAAAAPADDAAPAQLFVAPAWEAEPAADGSDLESTDAVGRHCVVLCDLAEIDAARLAALIPGADCAHLPQPKAGAEKAAEKADIGRRYLGYAQACFEKVKGVLAEKPRAAVLFQLVAPAAPEPALLAGLSGLLKTATEENPHVVGQIVLTDAASPAELAARLRREGGRLDNAVVRYAGGERQVLRWRSARTAQAAAAREDASFRNGGVYLITGGLGGLGIVFAREIMRRAANARIILTGRAELSAERRQLLDQLSREAVQQGGNPLEYRPLDLENREQVAQLVAAILAEYKQLNGIIHSAGMIADNLILNKTAEEFRKVLAPKVIGTVNLDEASRAVDLDFFALFSSAAGVYGNSGQADYAAANGFLDQYAAYRNRLAADGQRTGQTLSFDWPLWQEGGMAIDPASLEAMRRSTGLRPMRTATGLRIFHESLAARHGQVMVLEGDAEKIEAMLSYAPQPVRGRIVKRAAPAIDAARLKEETLKKIKSMFAEVTKRPAAKIDVQEELAAYGIDSIIISNLNLGLAKVFGEISKTLFFEFKTLADVAGHFIKEYPAECAAWTGLEQQAAAPDTIRAEYIVPAAETGRQPAAPAARTEAGGAGRREPIAIIGISGIYPQAADIDEFWDNLRTGKNCIGEIPSDRWALDDFYHPDVDQAVEQGKSYSKWGGFIEQFADFDPLFFNISPREAMNMDPQERLFLQECWRAMENAGYTRGDLKHRFRQRVGVFAGITKPGYNLYAMHPTHTDEPFLPYTSFSSAANRISYIFDITGPSMPVDTMCSSSLIAIHEACEHIHRGECEVAFAGGVNLYLHPYTYAWLCSHRMLSRDGLCKSFGIGSNGFVPGEGVGTVLLKPLSSALRDNDNIHGVILATHVNHGGKTNGYTVPSPKAQAELIRGAIDKAGIKATDISYIEAHGTGTELGDPIEISGLQQAFAPDGKETGYCKIGSAKSNIGHLEAAAGIAGLTKVLLQMKHRQIAPSLHAEQLNPNISFDKTAFRVNTSLSPWQPPAAGGRNVPRLAGISSFGATGANAHVIVQEYVAPERPLPAAARDGKVIVPLSARTAPQLEQKARDLLRFIRSAAEPIDLAAMAYTLQIGREAMDERLTCLADSVGQLAEKLEAHLAGRKDIDDFYRGQAGGGKDALHLFDDDEDFQETLDKWIARRKLSRLAELWARGMDFDWNKLYGETRPPRIALPAYPFAKERLWVDAVVETAHAPAKAAGAAKLHPLVHANTSDLSRQRYTSVFTGDEFFLRDHKVRGEKILPAVAYLEMARTAVDLALPAPVEDSLLELRNTTWAQPIAVSCRKDVSIALHAEEDDRIEFEIYSAEAGETLHCQGQAVFVRMPAPAKLDIERLKAAMSKGREDVAGIYDNYREMGVDFGAAHRAIQAVHLGERQLLAQLSLPAAAGSTGDAYLLHPSLMDSALQASIGLMDDSIRRSRRPFLPFALETLRVVAPCTREMYAWVRRAPDAGAAAGMVRFDVDLCDQEGNICVQLHGFSSRTLEGELQPAAHGKPSEPARPQLHSLAPVWNRVSPPVAEKAIPKPADVLVAGGGQRALAWARRSWPEARLLELPAHADVDTVREKLAAMSFDHLLWVAPDVMENGAGDEHERIVGAQDEGVLAVFRLAKALLSLDYADKNLQWTLITRNTQRVKESDVLAPAHAGIFGLVGSMAKEYPEWDIRLLDVDDLGSLAAAECLAWPGDKQGDGLAYRRGEWFRQGLAQVAALPEAPPAYRQGGVYIVVGGAGGIGEVWSRFMRERYDAKLVWIGRRPLDAAIEAKLQSLGGVTYFSADATDLDALRRVRDKILEIHPAIHGVVHSAIDLQDQSVALMDESTFRGSLSAKVDVSVNLERVFGADDLDCMLFFSSLISFTKGAGQSNYAAGCTFKDSFAHSLAQRRPYPVKIMNWGYWGNVGVVTSEFYNKRMQQMGIGSIEAPEAMEALQALVGAGLDQLALVKTLDARVIEDIALAESVSCFPQRAASVLPQARKDVGETFAAKSRAALRQDLLGEETRALAGDILASSLAALGLFDPAAARPAEEATHPLHERWLRTSLDYLRREPCRVMALDAAWAEWDAKKPAWLVNPNLGAQVALVEACLRALPDILTGKRPATDVMFPNSSMQLVEGVYKGHALADYSNDVLGATLVACIKRKLEADGNGGGKIRILEIGAGTGGTTARILPMLREFSGAIAEYCYTDLSKAFLMHAEEQYQPQLPALTTAIFDVSKPLQAQPVAMNRYDFAIATNVLHATPDIRETLRNAKALLKNQGVLLLNEMCDWSLFSHLTFGLLEGWWLYEDAPLRLAGSPGLTPQKWQDVLEEEGFEAVSFLAPEAHELGQQIIAASSNGRARQRIARQAAPAAVAAAAAAVPASGASTAVARSAPAGAGSLREKCVAYLQEVVAKTLKMDASQVAAGRSLTDYGLDSILVVGLTNQLRKSFPGITSTLFFEAQNIAGLADYLLENKKEHVLALLGANAPAAAPQASPSLPSAPAAAAIAAASGLPRLARRGSSRFAAQAPATAPASAIFDVAIIGLSGRYPQARTLDEFWRNLANGRNCVTEIPAERWDWKEYYDPEKGKLGKIYTKWGGFLEEIDRFDPLFFKISPKEAKIMDPQERLFLESCYHAIEDAGYTPETLGEIDKIGVFAGVMNARYNTQPLYYSIANRVSFVLNFQGPSMAVDTACSSSLTAIHLALESMYSGLSECAIAGGVNLIIDPVHYQELSALTMLSAGNQCKSFGDGADGFIDAEGVGAVVLKPLWKAEQDGDHIYGVIKASAINAGGKTNGYTVPNPIAQAAVVAKALQRANVNAADISYIEAHGTGTALGDPIEIAGLKRAFEQHTKDKQFCAIGSLKSNIGHCESAAGIAALTKVLLQFKHKQLAPSLHADVINHEIDFVQTPFRVQNRLEQWSRLRRVVDDSGAAREIPRMAGISSFGAGGANAHIIVQEYEPAAAATEHRPASVVIPLSARTADQLKQKAADLRDFLRASGRARESVSLLDMAFTLQVGREAMEERLGFVVASLDELEDRLDAWLRGEQAGAGVHRGRVKRNHEVVDADLQQAVARWTDDRVLPQLADAWVKGAKVEWQRLYAGARPRRIALPTYPFARESYWRERTDIRHGASKPAGAAVLHPLVHRNVSDIRQQCYRSVFDGSEFFAADHRIAVDGTPQKAIPAMAYLEMARAAVADATSSVPEAIRARQTLELFDIVWAEPALLGGRKQVSIALFAQRDDLLSYEIYSSAADGAEEVIHCQGQAVLSGEPAPARIDLAQLNSQMRHGARDTAAHYGAIAQAGVHYGASQQAIAALHVGDGQLLAQLMLPGAVDDAPALHEGLVLHPVMLDGALQAAFALLAPQDQPSLPLALESLRILRACAREMFAWVRHSPDGNAEHASLRLDIDLCDREGNVCVQMRGVTYERESLRDTARPSAAAAPAALIAPTVPTAPTAPAARPEPAPAAALARTGVVLSAPEAQTFASSASAKPTQISLTMDL
ncbi:MAG TPA: SDR family NAD(P)-dependent oxidoreductase [Paucimonas sp.]|nr:SDR family NAD(P)-dependent oxidoreductase [Paucimonas sp.]